MSKVLVASLAGVVLLACAGYVLAADAPDAGPQPASGSTTQSSPEDEQFVKDTLAKVKPHDPVSADAAEDALVEHGRGPFEAALKAAFKDGKDEQLTPLVNAIMRLGPKFDPRKEIRAYVKGQPKWADQDVEARIRPQVIINHDIKNTAGDNLFYLVRFPMYPVARMVPPPLGASNIFVLGQNRKTGKIEVTLVVDADGLKTYLSDNLRHTTTVDQAKVFTKVWLRLSQEFANDGMMHFAIADDDVTAEKKDDGVIVATGKATVDRGGKGDLEATLTFDKDGKLSEVKETKDIKAGMRPKCQAKKLLDKDEVVRYMARESLLLMGTDAHDYMFEVRATASPELQKAIDDVWREILRDEQRFGKK